MKAIPSSTGWRALAAAVCLAVPSPGTAQFVPIPRLTSVAQAAEATPGDVAGVVRDGEGHPLAGAVVSALGSTTAFAVSDKDGRYVLRGLPAGPYLIRAHLQGYAPARGRLLQVAVGARGTTTITMTKQAGAGAPASVLEAGVGGGSRAEPAVAEPAEHDHDELAWRLRHARRSVLREATLAGSPSGESPFDVQGSVLGESFAGLARAVDSSARLASALFADLELQGQLNILTSASFDRPQELFSSTAGLPHGVAYVALSAPAARGEWRARGAITQGDLSSWVVAGSFLGRATATHAYEAGFSFGMQRYFGGNAEALVAMRDGGRNVGAMYAFDTWAPSSRLQIGYGAEYASYDYLPDSALLSPRLNVAVKPVAGDTLAVRATMSHRETAPGAVEFNPPKNGVWVLPERTFSAVSQTGFRAQRVDHLEVAAERPLPGHVTVAVRAFRQRGTDQVATLFGGTPGGLPSTTAHYYVGSAGDFEALGWGVTVSREFAEGTRASLDYTQAGADWTGGASADRGMLGRLAGSTLRDDERLRDLTATIESIVPATSTRVYVLYKVNSAFAGASADSALPGTGARFDVQISQALPFLRFSNARWEALVAVRNVFNDDVLNASVYDELLVVRPPKRVLGGVTVRF